MKNLFEFNPSVLIRVTIATSILYLCIIIFQRITGKRSLAQWNSFDFVVNVAIGSLLASTALSDSSIFDGAMAVATLFALQFAVTWLSVRSSVVNNFIKFQPTLVFYKGEFLDSYMKKERITKEEIFASIREHGRSSSEEIAAVILETDGSLSVIESQEFSSEKKDTLEEVEGFSKQKSND